MRSETTWRTHWPGSMPDWSFVMPLSRPMPDIGNGVHELRLRARSGAYRVVYALVQRRTVHVLHGFKKTTQSTSARNLELARKRLKEIRS